MNSSKVFIIIYGEKGETDKLRLKRLDADAFERGQTDVIKVTGANVGTINKINISHDGTQIGDGWYLDNVSVEVNDKSYK